MSNKKSLEMADGDSGNRETNAEDPTNKPLDGDYEGGNVFQRYISPSAIVGFGFTLQASWEGAALGFQLSLPNGGPASLVYGSVFVGIGTLSIVLSLAEMASMDPVVGAQYRWSAAFAPRNPEFWGLFQGWATVLAWITTAAASPIYLGNVVVGLAVFNYESYIPKPWHLTLIMIAFILIAVIPNFYCRRLLNPIEMIGGVCHFIFFIVSVIVLAAKAQWGSSNFVFDTLIHDQSGWTNPALCWALGLMAVTFPLSAFDGILHMSDEVKNPRIRVPWSMIISISVDAMLMFVFMICLMYTLGDLGKVANTPTGLPIIEVYYQATQSKHATNILVFMMAFVVYLSFFNMFASVSRLIWSFATDRGLPFSRFFSKVNPTLEIPLNALLLVAAVCILLAIIPIGSKVAFDALISLPTISLYISYFIPILFIVIRKLQGRHPQYGPYKLGRWGLSINLFALCYILFMLSFVAIPPYTPVNKDNMNYAGPLVVGVMALSLADWIISGRRRFQVPVPCGLQGE